jgi:hypothetical protein
MQEYINQLARVYNTLLDISTKGEDTLLMADCLRVFQGTLTQMNQEIQQQSTEQREEE